VDACFKTKHARLWWENEAEMHIVFVKAFMGGRFRIILQVKVLASFVVLGNWTEQGIRNVQDAPKRIKETHSMVEKAGGKMQLFYTLGKYDFAMIIEVPNDDAVMAVLLCLGSMGNVRTITMKAWTEAEGAKILKAPHP
jgi:uncharacterized protein with GYD domain